MADNNRFLAFLGGAIALAGAGLFLKKAEGEEPPPEGAITILRVEPHTVVEGGS